MKVDSDMVHHVAQLARLSLSESEVVWYQEQLGRMLDYVDQLRAMPDQLGPDFRADTLAPATLERADVPGPTLPAEEAVSQAARRSGTAFQVPKFLD